MHCIRCGKSGFFLRVNDAMLCKKCAAAQAELDRKKQEELARKQAMEKTHEFREAKDFYDMLRNAYRIVENDMIFPSTLGLSAAELDLKYKACTTLIQNLPLWKDYPMFEEVYARDCVNSATSNYIQENPHLPLCKFSVNSRPNFDHGVSEMIDKLCRISTKIILDSNKNKSHQKSRGPHIKHTDAHNIQGRPYFVAGTRYYEKNILKLTHKNADYALTKQELIDMLMYEQDIPRYTFNPDSVDLVPEPDNPHDGNAIKVVIDGQHVGYIKAASCEHLLEMIRQRRIKSISCSISGGPYKRVIEHYDIERDRESYSIRRGEIPYVIELSIIEKVIT